MEHWLLKYRFIDNEIGDSLRNRVEMKKKSKQKKYETKEV